MSRPVPRSRPPQPLRAALLGALVLVVGLFSAVPVLASRPVAEVRIEGMLHTLVVAVTTQNLATSSALFADERAERQFLELARAYGASPTIVKRTR